MRLGRFLQQEIKYEYNALNSFKGKNIRFEKTIDLKLEQFFDNKIKNASDKLIKVQNLSMNSI